MSSQPTFDELLNVHLAAADRSMRWVARRLDVDPTTVSRWSRGETTPRDKETVSRLADVLGVHDVRERAKLMEAAGFVYRERQRGADAVTHPASPSSNGHAMVTGGFFVQAVERWGSDVMELFRWGEAPEHARSSWASRLVYALGVVTEQITPQQWLSFLVAFALWLLANWLLAPSLGWPVGDVAARRLAFTKLAIAMLAVPLVVAGVTRAEREKAFQIAGWRARLQLWALKVTGALVGFVTFMCITMGQALLWYYVSGSPMPAGLRALFVVVPLFISYVVARRIPADRLEMFGGTPRIHDADRLFLIVFLFFGPAVAAGLYVFYDVLVDRLLGAGVVLGALIVVTWWEIRTG